MVEKIHQNRIWMAKGEMMNLRSCFLFTVLLFPISVFSFDVSVQNYLLMGSTTTPLWLSSNDWGEIQNGKKVQNITSGSIGDRFNFADAFGFSYQSEGAIAFCESGVLPSFSVLLFETHWNKIQFRAGWFKETIGEVYEPLSSGSMALSANAKPMPKIELRLSDWWTLPFGGDSISLRAGIQHGWFDNEGYAQNVLLHGKWAYLRFGNEKQYITGGLVHFAQWAGTFKDPLDSSLTLTSPATLWNFWQAFVAGGAASGGSSLEALNAYGNHLGIWDFSTGITISGWKLIGYYQHYFEDMSSLQIWSNGLDGLAGFAVETPNEMPFIRAFLLEKVVTTDQSGPLEEITFSDGSRANIYGGDSYYYNYIYKNGWTYLGEILGTPLLSTSGTGSDLRINSNRIDATHYGIKINIKDFSIIAFYTYTMRYPAYSEQSLVSFTSMADKVFYKNHKDRWDTFFRFSWNPKMSNSNNLGFSSYLEGAVGYDELFGWNWGAGFGLRYSYSNAK